MEPTAPMAASLTAEAVDGGGRDGVLAAVVNNSNGLHRQRWCLQSIAAAAMDVVVINCAAAFDAAATILLPSLMSAAKTPLTAAAVDIDRHCHRQ
jgi:hypothetical protein